MHGPTIFAIVAALLAASSAHAAKPEDCPIKVERVDRDEGSGHITATNNALPLLETLAFEVLVEREVTTVGGTTITKSWIPVSTDSYGTREFLYSETVRFPLELLQTDTGKFDEGTLVEARVAHARFTNGAECKAGKLTKPVPCTLPATLREMQPHLVTIMCMLDPSITTESRAKQERAVQAKLSPSQRSCDLRKNIIAMLVKEEAQSETNDASKGEPRSAATAEGVVIGLALTKAATVCPSVFRTPDLLSSTTWHVWPHPDCFEACTGSKANNPLDQRTVADFSSCTSYCSAHWSDEEIAKIHALSESDRMSNYGKAKALPTKKVKRLLSVELEGSAKKILASYEAKEDQSLSALCGDEARCYVLRPLRKVKALAGVEKIGVVIFKDQIQAISFTLAYGDWPTNGPDLVDELMKELGEPTEKWMFHDRELGFTMAEAGAGRQVARWHGRNGSIYANILDFNPLYREGQAAEVVYARVDENDVP